MTDRYNFLEENGTQTTSQFSRQKNLTHIREGALETYTAYGPIMWSSGFQGVPSLISSLEARKAHFMNARLLSLTFRSHIRSVLSLDWLRHP